MDTDQAFLEDVFKAMSSNYESIFLVDLEQNKITPYRRNPALPEAFWNYVDTNPTYDDLVLYYVNSRVADGDKQRMMRFVCYDMVQQILKKQTAFSYDYRVKNKDGFLWYRMRFAKISEGNEIRRFAVSFENVSEERKQDVTFYKAGKKILIISESEEERELFRNTLGGHYQILTAANSPDGLEILEKEFADVVAVVVKEKAGVGEEACFLNQIKGVRRYSSIPVIILSEVDDVEVEIAFLKAGASDYIHEPYNAELVSQRIECLVRLRRHTALLNTEEKDSLTGLYTKAAFFRYADEIIYSNPDKDYWIVVADIERFKVINDRYGVEKGDEVLRYLATRCCNIFPGFLMGGRIGGDKFVFLQTEFRNDKEFGRSVTKSLTEEAPVPGFVVKFGLYKVKQNCEVSVQSMCDRARLALESVKGSYDRHMGIYNDKIREDLILNQQILNSMETALKENQIQIYLQPKYDMAEQKIGGAEALVRWFHPELGFLSPGLFIPIFEKNDFIKELDTFVVKEVCTVLKRWKEEGRPLVPISVNLSRRDFENDRLAYEFAAVVDYYGVDHSMIHVELTESAFTENPDKIAVAIKQLHENGFVIELDDFGTGYSSMTTLSSVDIDILKLDMSIIQKDDPESDKNILDFCMQLAKMMRLRTVAEGAETEAQTLRLKDLGCDYVQGYYYSKPLPVDQFEEYLEKHMA